tara:strand:+ start:35 stop:292 length:258 start_codon:yes stop_codon:yes gene_type:complete
MGKVAEVVFRSLPLIKSVFLILKIMYNPSETMKTIYLIRNFFGCVPFVKLIRKGKAEQLLTKISSVNAERDSRSLKQQGPFLNAV